MVIEWPNPGHPFTFLTTKQKDSKMAKKSSLDDKVLKLMAEVQKRRQTVGTLKKPTWLTSCSLNLPGFDRINIQIEKDLDILAIAIGTLQRMHDDIIQLVKEGITPAYKWNNYPIKDWITDLKLRIQITQIKAEQEKLDKLEATLNTLTSEDQRREMALANIEAELLTKL